MQRHLRKLSRSLVYKKAHGHLVPNKHGDLVLPRTVLNKKGKSVDPGWVRSFSYDVTDKNTGEISRRKTTRVGYYQSGSGCVLGVDGLRAGHDIMRLLESRSSFALSA